MFTKNSVSVSVLVAVIAVASSASAGSSGQTYQGYIPVERYITIPTGYSVHPVLKPGGVVVPEAAAMPGTQQCPPMKETQPSPQVSAQIEAAPASQPEEPTLVSGTSPVSSDSPVSLTSAERDVPVLPAEEALKWNSIDHYSFAPDNGTVVIGDQPAATASAVQQGVKYNSSVTVFPLDETDGGSSSQPVQVPSYQPVSLAPPPVTESLKQTMLRQLFFAHASAKIAAADKKALVVSSSEIATRADFPRVTVIGHASHRVDGVTDPVERKVINFAMAQKRAAAVTRVMISAGVQPSWVESVSKGEDEPNADPGSRSQEAADRRVEVYVAP